MMPLGACLMDCTRISPGGGLFEGPHPHFFLVICDRESGARAGDLHLHVF